MNEVEEGHKISYGKALSTILKNVMYVILFSGLKAPAWLLPQTLKELQVATDEYKSYLVESIEEERGAAQKGEKTDNLLSTLVRANEAAKNEDGGKMVLNNDELYGNLFMFNMAGYETTVSLR